MRKDFWTPEELAAARALRARHAPADEYLTVIGRSKAAAFSHMYAVDNATHVEALRKERLEKIRQQQRLSGGASPFVAKLKHVPDDVILEAQRRSEAPHTITSYVFGDPPIGYRAIDRKREQETA